jgi:hypothetical protein
MLLGALARLNSLLGCGRGWTKCLSLLMTTCLRLHFETAFRGEGKWWARWPTAMEKFELPRATLVRWLAARIQPRQCAVLLVFNLNC